ncbi:hypothetical protein LCGC14_0497730 [marine sediment metagenome]|uniref:Uncharacterized protein n=1 Tax=marine sediment metagenome TaxID=412755 RepID=A0A0F9VDI7_9ZZZZ
MHVFGFTSGLVFYLTCQSLFGLWLGLNGWSVFWLGLLALALAQVSYLAWIVLMTQQEARRRARAG